MKKTDFYYLTPQSSRFLEHYVHRPVPPHVDDTIITIDHRWVNRPDLLSLDLYGSDEYAMAIAIRNGLEDPVFDLVYGLKLYVPTFTRLQEIYG